MSKKIKIVSATNCSKEQFEKESTLWRCRERLKHIEFDVIYDNFTGLPNVYNRFLNQENKDYINVFVHDDVEIFSNDLEQALNNSPWAITGLAGGSGYTLKEPYLWHLSCPSDKLSGAVTHPVWYQQDGVIIKSENQVIPSVYGPWPKRCTVIDGLFMAVNVEKALETGFKFDEDFNFHFYDISSCLIANQCKMTVGTYPIHVVHQGLGDSAMSEEWKKERAKFIKKWN